MRTLFGWIGGLVFLLSIAAPASAISFTWTTSNPFGLMTGSSCGGSTNCVAASFQLDAISPSSGVLTLTDPVQPFVVNNGTLSITLPSASFSSTVPVGGVDQIVFSNVTYTANVSVVPFFDGTTWSLAAEPSIVATVTISGTVTQYLGGGIVTGPSAFVDTADLSALACTSTDNLAGGGSFGGTCGFTVGGQGDFQVEGLDFVHTFNQAVPEPATLGLLALGLLAGGRRARQGRARR